jgi:ATP-dependent helicase Lhr and Lhr-like helicase
MKTLPRPCQLSQAQREVLLGADPDVDLSQRAKAALATLCESADGRAWDGGAVIARGAEQPTWWTWAGARANATLAAAVPDVIEVGRRIDNHRLHLRPDTTPDEVRAALDAIADQPMPAPLVLPDAVDGLKFGDVLPPGLATDSLAARAADPIGARAAATSPLRWVLEA